ncbi:hypothetical protein B0T14DRAFT_526744 [Immersiella caudata]|uniref:Uncharacterized protein n=1 Tax=Immersiella caudata TaxID=314043 RepID=A0AA40BU31_9PEZI|nr:hypothetical protein B0T14DRAFT_526744 [Immersiella caudata]
MRVSDPPALAGHRGTRKHISQKYHGSLMSLYMDAGYLHVTDPKDRVYGMLGIATDCGPDHDILVDYTLSLSEVYGQVFEHFIRAYDNLSFLCCTAFKHAEVEEMGGHCTWLPHPQARGSSFDLFVHTKGAGGAISVASSSTIQLALDLGTSANTLGPSVFTLTARGILVDRVERTGVHEALHLAPIDDWYADLESLITELPNSDDKITTESVLVGYMRRVKELDREEDRDSSKASIRSFYDLYARTLQRSGKGRTKGTVADMAVNENARLDSSPAFKDTVSHFLTCFAYTQFVKTQRGRLGIATSGHLEPGSEIWVVFGCPVLLVLHPTDGGRHSLRGQVWLDGLMDGEACERVDMSGVPTADYEGPEVVDLVLC